MLRCLRPFDLLVTLRKSVIDFEFNSTGRNSTAFFYFILVFFIKRRRFETFYPFTVTLDNADQPPEQFLFLAVFPSSFFSLLTISGHLNIWRLDV